MTTNDQHDGAAASCDLTYAEALAALHDSARFAARQVAFTAVADQVMAAWQGVESDIRAWVARMATLTEQQWRSEPETTHAFYEAMRQWFTEHDAACAEAPKASRWLKGD